MVTFTSKTNKVEDSIYVIRVGGLTNPYSLAPTSSSISLYTKTTPNRTSTYSKLTTGLIVTNTIPSTLTPSQLSYSFSNRVLSDQTDLSITFSIESQNIPDGQSVSYYEVLFAPSFAVSAQSALTC